MKNVGFISLGCSKNLVDTEIMIGILKEKGCNIVADESQAQVIVINTCAFIQSAKEEAIGTILEAAGHKEAGALEKIIVTGCLAQRYKEEVLFELPEVDVIVGIGRIEDIADAIEGEESVLLGNEEGAYPESAPRVLSTPPYSAYLKIAEGCDNRCTYCAIPLIRGRFRSRAMEDILSEARRLADGGVKEINVVAQDTTRYGEDIYGQPMLAKLLEAMCAIDGIKWIRVLYTYPERISEAFLKVVQDNDKIANYFDIPIQHISDGVLKRMNRKSSSADIYALIDSIRKRLPDAVIRTSLIVGFPGETQEDFEKLCEFVEYARFDRLGAFRYSKEEGTPASRLPGQIDEEIKKERYEKIMGIQRGIASGKGREHIGKVYRVLVEGFRGGRYFGRTMLDAPEVDGVVYFDSAKGLEAGAFAQVKIKKSGNYDLIGECVDEYSE